MSRHASELTAEQWLEIQSLIPKRKPSKKGGRKRVEDRRYFEGILWVLRNGARWKDLPAQYPSPATCSRRLQEWEDAGVWLNLWRKFLGELDEEGILSWDETFSDGTFSPANARHFVKWSNTVCHGPNRSGRSRQGEPVRRIQRIPLSINVCAHHNHPCMPC